MNKLKLLTLYTLLTLFIAPIAQASFDCFTWSNQILFKSTGGEEAQTFRTVVEGCMKHDFTNPQECEQNARCFPASFISMQIDRE